MENTEKKKNLLVIILLLLLAISCGFIVYEKTFKAGVNDDSDTLTPMTNMLALNIVQEKIAAANTFLGSLNTSHCSESLIKEVFYCNYGSKSIFEKEFYSIYSKNLSYKDVYIEHDFKTEKDSTNIVGIEEKSNTNNIDNDTNFVLHYGYDGDEVYVDSSCRASGHGTKLANFKVESLTDDKIEASFIVREDFDGVVLGITDSKEIERLKKDYNDTRKFDRYKVVLVKEDNLYKISSAVLLDGCGHLYKTGK